MNTSTNPTNQRPLGTEATLPPRSHPTLERLLPLTLEIQSLDSIARLRAFRELAAHSLSDALIVSQRVGAVKFLQEAPRNPLTDELRERAKSEFLMGQAISHIAPSFTGDLPLVTLAEEKGALRVRGRAPWVTGIGLVDFVATGATDQKGLQHVLLIPRHDPAVTFSVADSLVALRESETGSMVINDMKIAPEQLLLSGAAPLTTHRNGKLCFGYPPLSTSMLAVGHAQRCLQSLEDVAQRVPLFEPLAVRLAAEIQVLGSSIELHARSTATIDSHLAYEELRARANVLAVNAAQLNIAAIGGQGFMQNSLASQLAAESRFFLVWALSPAAKVRTMELLARQTTASQPSH